MWYFRPVGGAPPMDVRLRPGPAKLPTWIYAVVVLIAASAVALVLTLAGFGLFAALRIAHGYDGSIEHAAAAPVAGAWQRKPSRVDPAVAARIAPPVVARSDPAENELRPQTESMWIEAAGDAARHGLAAESAPSGARPSAPDAAPAGASAAASATTEDSAAKVAPMASIDRAAPRAPRPSSAVPPSRHAKPQHAVKRPVVRKRVRRVVAGPAYYGAATNQFQPTLHSRRRATNSARTASPFQPMFSSP